MGQVKLPAGGLADIRRTIEEKAGPNAVAALREAGRRLAGEAEEVIARRAGSPLPALPMTRFWSELSRYFQETGWGELSHEPVSEAIGSLVTREWAEVDPTENRSYPSCHITTGLLAEILSQAVGKPVAVMQVECVSRGDSVCRFLFGSPSNLLSVHQKLSENGTLEEALAALS